MHGTHGRGRDSGCRLVLLTVLFVTVGLVAASSASAATRYMAPGGSGSLCSLASPCGSMNSAYQGAMLGDTIVMAAGNYGGQDIAPRSLPGTNSQTPSGEEITFKPQVSGATVTIDGMILGGVRSAPVEHIAFEDLTFTDWTATRSSEDVHFTRTTHRAQLHANWAKYLSYTDGEVGPFVDGTGDGIQFNQIDGRAGDHILIDGMRIHDIHPDNTAAHPDAIQFYGPWHDLTLRRSKIYNNDNINLRGDGEMQRYVVENNFFGAAKNPVVSRYYTAQIQGNGAIIRYNSFDGALQPSGTNERSGQVWEGNVMTWSTCAVTGDDSTVRYNVWVGGNNCGTNYKSVSNPGWVGAGNGDLHLTTSSPAIGAGNPASFPATDVDKEGRPAGGSPDAGADESNGTAPPPPPPPPPPDSQAPTAPGGLSATGGRGQVALSWGASTDNVGVTRYNVHRGTAVGFTPTDANRVAQPTGTSYTDTGLAAGDYHYWVTAEDAAGNVSSPSASAQAMVTSDTSPPTVALTAPMSGVVSGTVEITASASDDSGVAGVQFKVDATNLGAEDTVSPYLRSWNTTGVANGLHTLTAVARDAAGNTTTSAPVVVTVVNVDPNPTGLVAAYGFEEGSGAAVSDRSGFGNDGTLSGATREAGRFGQALSFDGVNDLVTVADAGSLDLTNAMTLSAWVRPSSLSAWRTVLLKEQPGNLAYALYANTDTDLPAASVVTDRYRDARGGGQLSANAWRHIATTYDGSTLRLYLDGNQVGSAAVSGPLVASAGVLRIGGNAVWDEWFQGRIDEVRVYRSVLDQAAIQADMAAPVVPGTVPPDTQAPSAALTAPVAASTVAGTIGVRASASDDRGVSGVQFRLDGATLGAQDTAAPYQVDWNTTQVADGQHTLTAVARDAAGNMTTSQPVTVTVRNAVLPTLPPPLPPGKVKAHKPGGGGRSSAETLSISSVQTSQQRICRKASMRCKSATTLLFRLSEPAPVLVVVEPVGAVGAVAQRARSARVIRLAGRRGINRVRLTARGFKPGRYRIAVKPVGMALAKPARGARLRVR